MDFITPDEAPGQLMQRIVQNQMKRAPELILFDFPITELPDVVYTLYWLKRLVVWREKPIGSFMRNGFYDFICTKLQLTPDGLVDKDGVTELIDWDQRLRARPIVALTHLSDRIGELQELEELDLADQLLTVLPEAVCRLPNLKRLILRNNRLTQLPANFTQLTKLERLDLSGNPVTEWPENFFAMPIHTAYANRIDEARQRKRAAVDRNDFEAAAEARLEEMNWGFSF